MCEYCVEKLNRVPQEAIAVLEKYRAEMTALAQKMGDEVAKHLVDITPVADADTEERKQLQTTIDHDMGFISLIGAACYAASAGNHAADSVHGIADLSQQALSIGYYKSGAELYQAHLN